MRCAKMKTQVRTVLALALTLFLCGCGADISNEGPKAPVADPPHASIEEGLPPLRIELRKETAVITWPKVKSAACYRVDILGENGRRETLVTNDTTYTDPGLSKGVFYTYRVTALDSSGTVLNTCQSSARINEYKKVISDES